MLHDNALLIDLMTEVWRETQSPLYASRISETVDWLAREMVTDEGGFAASLDADSEGEEGKFYVWSKTEIADALGAEDAALFCDVYDVTDGGNFEGHNILNRLKDMSPRAGNDERRLADAKQKLFERRSARVRPGFDDKILADWNGLTIAALSRASTVFGKPEWRDMAERAFKCVTTKLGAGNNRLFHAYRAGQAKAPATAADYANMTWAALRLYQSTLNEDYLKQAVAWSDVLDAHYADDTSGGYFTVADDTTDVVVRLMSAGDDAVPSANAVHLSNLFALHALTGREGYATSADKLLSAFAEAMLTRPVGHCGIIAASLDANALIQIVTSGPASGLAEAVNHVSAPGALTFNLPAGATRDLPEAFLAKLEFSGASGASHGYVCRGTTCFPPVSNGATLKGRIDEARR